MRRPSLTALIALIAFAALVVYGLLWLSVTDKQIGRSDFTSTYMGATLWRDGHRADLYDRDLQSHLHSQLIAPDTEGNLPFVNPPSAAVIAVPVSFLDLRFAYRIWSLVQIAMLVTAVLIVAKFAPNQTGSRYVVIALAIPGTLALLLLGQWDGLSALSLAGGYAALRKGRGVLAGAILSAGLLSAKPHLALGIAALLIGWRERAVLKGAILGSGAVLAVDAAAVGWQGILGYLSIESYDASRWNLASFLGFNGLIGSWVRNATVVQIVAASCSVIALLICLWIGTKLRSGGSLETAAGAAVLLSLVASPHLLSHDLVVLSPALVWLVGSFRDRRAVLTGWLVICAASLLDLGNERPAPPGRLVPIALIGFAGLLVVQLRR